MSLLITRAILALIKSFKATALEPLLSGPLLWGLTAAPPAIRAKLIEHVSKAVGAERLPKVVRALKWLFVLGVLRKANGVLNRWALNNWVWKHDRSKWVWEQEVAVVTGGCGGIGSWIVKGLAGRGVKVAVLDISELPGDLEKDPNVRLFKCDITDEAKVFETADSIFATMGVPSILVNNAGIAHAHTILEAKAEYLQKIFAVNVFSNFYTVKAFLPGMIAKKKGQIVTVASSASFITVPGLVDYVATKSAVFSFHEGLNLELKHRYNAPYIITTSIHPTYAQTPLVDSFSKSLATSKPQVLDAKDVGGIITNQIFSLQGGELVIPEVNSVGTLFRGLPSWLKAVIFDGTKDHVIAG